jgi:hypothetical protein
MNRTSNVRKQNSSGHFSPKSPDCLPDGSGSLICSLTDQENLRDKIPKRRRLWTTPGCNAMEEEEGVVPAMLHTHPFIYHRCYMILKTDSDFE